MFLMKCPVKNDKPAFSKLSDFPQALTPGKVSSWEPVREKKSHAAAQTAAVISASHPLWVPLNSQPAMMVTKSATLSQVSALHVPSRSFQSKKPLQNYNPSFAQ